MKLPKRLLRNPAVARQFAVYGVGVEFTETGVRVWLDRESLGYGPDSEAAYELAQRLVRVTESEGIESDDFLVGLSPMARTIFDYFVPFLERVHERHPAPTHHVPTPRSVSVAAPVRLARPRSAARTTRRRSRVTAAHGPPGRSSSGDDDPHELGPLRRLLRALLRRQR